MKDYLEILGMKTWLVLDMVSQRGERVTVEEIRAGAAAAVGLALSETQVLAVLEELEGEGLGRQEDEGFYITDEGRVAMDMFRVWANDPDRERPR